MNKNKLYCQILASMLILGIITAGSRIEDGTLAGYAEKAKSLVMRQMTMEDVQEAGAFVSAKLSGAPAKVIEAVSKANTASKYGEPIDEKSETSVKQVHAVAGGMVIASGKDKERGLYIEIKHDDAVSVYGNLSEIGVVESERVQRGEIIGSYDTSGEKDFFYELRENL